MLPVGGTQEHLLPAPIQKRYGYNLDLHYLPGLINPLVSNEVMSVIPEWPAIRFFHVVPVLRPRGVTIPIPVITTRGRFIIHISIFFSTGRSIISEHSEWINSVIQRSRFQALYDWTQCDLLECGFICGRAIGVRNG